VPDFLPALHPAEEMVIARVHVSVSVSVRFYVLLTFWLIFLLLLDSRSNIVYMLFTFFEMLARFTRSYLCFPTSSSFTNQSVTLSQVVCDISDLLSRRDAKETIGDAETQIFQRRLRQDVLDDLLISMVTENNLAFRLVTSETGGRGQGSGRKKLHIYLEWKGGNLLVLGERVYTRVHRGKKRPWVHQPRLSTAPYDTEVGPSSPHLFTHGAKS
jgi:hypothetical protein